MNLYQFLERHWEESSRLGVPFRDPLPIHHFSSSPAIIIELYGVNFQAAGKTIRKDENPSGLNVSYLIHDPFYGKKLHHQVILTKLIKSGEERWITRAL